MKHGMIRQDLSHYYFNTYTIYGKQHVKAYKPETYDFTIGYNILNDKRHNIINQINTFDIETTTKNSDKPYAFMYHWQMCVGGDVIFGRTWEEFINFYKKIITHYHVSRETHFVIYVHNLSYEFQFLKSFFIWEDVFATKKRTILRATTIDGIEFRCSYFLANQSLELFTENMHCEHRKVKGEVIDEEEGFIFDYNKYRTPFTIMEEEELSYCYNDVKGLYEAIEELLKSEDDTLLTVPMTSTGYVRRDMRSAVKSNKYMRNLKAILPDYHIYELLKEEFRGGDTHANYLCAGIQWEDIEAWDITSSYPYVIMVKKYPMSRFIKGDICDISDYIKQDKAILMRVRYNDICIKDIWDMPYISYSKCKTIKGAKCDNGRILSADELTITINEIDYKIIKDCYNYTSIDVNEVYFADKGYLPTGIRETTLHYFEIKSQLSIRKKELSKKRKTVGLNKEEENELATVSKNYMKSKNKLNGIYGMFATDPVREGYIFDGMNLTKKEIIAEKELEEHNNKWSTFLAYQWGAWVTAYARERLCEIRNLEKGRTIYNDTDSVYWPKGGEELIKRYNAICMEEILKAPIPPMVKVNGETFMMGPVELDGVYKKFITWGAKRYGVIKEDDTISLTVSGLGKEVGKQAIERDGFDAFRPGWTVEKCGNLTAYYNDVEKHYIKLDGKKVLTGSNVALIPSSFTLNLTREYNDLIGYIREKIL